MRYLLLIGLLFNTFLHAQEEKPITTAFPFLSINTDAAAAGMGEVGVCSQPSAFAQRNNAAKYIFTENTSGVGVSYTPYLNKLVKDIFLGNITYYKRTQRSAWGASLTYFSIGNVSLTQDFGGSATVLGSFRPTEFTFDLSYNLKLSEHFAMGVAARYLNSNLQLPTDDKAIARGLGFDISGYYTSAFHLIGNYTGSYSFGFQLSNIGAKVKYDDLGKSFFLPTNLKLGVAYHLMTDSYNRFSLLTEVNKLLVPSTEAKDKDFIEGLFTSFSDAPNGFSEELHELIWAVGAEYAFDEQLFLRTGYYHQHKNKGDRQYITVGAGFAFHSFKLDVAYLFNTSSTNNPLNSSLRAGLQYVF
jgi:hypothetical protein